MRSILSVASACLFTTSALSLSLHPRSKENYDSQYEKTSRPRAAYFLDNDPNGNTLVAMTINDNGTLSNPTRTPTGGNGQLGNTATGQAGPDSLFSQDAVVVSNDYLFTVNPGSNTLSFFRIPKDDPTHPVLVGKPHDTAGDFPMSVAYSSKLKTACVLNGGARSGVVCFEVDHADGLYALDELPHDVAPALNQTTPPLGPAGTASDLFFNPSSTALFATIKGRAGDNALPGSILAWPVDNKKKIATTAVISTVPGVLLDFSGSFLGSDANLLLTDPSHGATLLAVSSNFTVTVTRPVVVPDQRANCWSVFAPRFNTVYLIDAGRPNVTMVDPATGNITGTIGYDASANGGFDAAVDRTKLYIAAADASVVVIDLEGSNSGKTPTQLQKFDLSVEALVGGGRKGWQGMATYP